MTLKFNVITLCFFAVWGIRNSADERGRLQCSCAMKAAIPVLEPPIVPDRHGLHGGSKIGSRLNIVTLVYDKAFRV